MTKELIYGEKSYILNIIVNNKGNKTMENPDIQHSFAMLGERIEKTAENPYGWIRQTAVNPGDTVCLVLGGQSTTTDSSVNHYCSEIEKLLNDNGLRQNVRIMGIINNYGSELNPETARTELMNEFNRGEKHAGSFNAETINPQYIEDIYNMMIKPRLCDENGTKLSTDEACRRMRKLNIYAHCHGGYTAMKLERLTLKKMEELGYLPDEREKIEKNLLVLGYAPFCPLGSSKSTMISFASGEDKVVSHNNLFENTLKYLKDKLHKKLPMSFFAGNKGNLFYVSSLGNVDQHEFNGFSPDEKLLNGDGKMMMKMIRNTIINGVKSSLGNLPLGETRDIVASSFIDKAFVDSLQKKGEELWEKLQDFAFKNRSEIVAYAAWRKAREQENPDFPAAPLQKESGGLWQQLKSKMADLTHSVKTIKNQEPASVRASENKGEIQNISANQNLR